MVVLTEYLTRLLRGGKRNPRRSLIDGRLARQTPATRGFSPATLKQRFRFQHQFHRFFRRGGDRAQVAHLAAFARAELFVEVQPYFGTASAGRSAARAERPSGPGPRASASGRPAGSRSRRAATTSTAPRGRLHTARTSCSNWLVTQARSLAW